MLQASTLHLPAHKPEDPPEPPPLPPLASADTVTLLRAADGGFSRPLPNDTGILGALQIFGRPDAGHKGEFDRGKIRG